MNATSTSARAREVDALVLVIARQMVEGRWIPGVSNAEMAAAQDVAVGTVDEWASDAGRLLRLAPDVSTIAAINLQRLDSLYGLSVRTGELKAAVSAVAEQNKMVGAHAPEKHKHEHDVRIQSYAALSPAETLEKVREQIRALQDVERELAMKTSGVGLDPPSPSAPAASPEEPAL